MEEKITYGLLLSANTRYNSNYLVARLVKREGDHHAPRNCTRSSCYDDRPHYDGLSLTGFVTERNGDFLQHDPRYENVYSIEENDAIQMAKVLRKINKRIRDDNSHEPQLVFMSLCKALKLSFCVEQIGDSNSSSYDSCRWKWMSVFEGCIRWGKMIEELRARQAA